MICNLCHYEREYRECVRLITGQTCAPHGKFEPHLPTCMVTMEVRCKPCMTIADLHEKVRKLEQVIDALNYRIAHGESGN